MGFTIPHGPALGEVIRTCVDRKIFRGKAKNKSEIARHFDMKPSSLYGWIDNGRVARHKMPEILAYFSDVSTPEEWGLEDWPDWAGIPKTKPGAPAPASETKAFSQAAANAPPGDKPQISLQLAPETRQLMSMFENYFNQEKTPRPGGESALLQYYGRMDDDTRRIFLMLAEHLAKK